MDLADATNQHKRRSDAMSSPHMPTPAPTTQVFLELGEDDAYHEVARSAKRLNVGRGDEEGTDKESDGGGAFLDDVQVVGHTGTSALRDLPHARRDCAVHPFDASPPKHCPQCYCYVCDKPASSCALWSAHCHATPACSMWKFARRLASAGVAALSEHCTARTGRAALNVLLMREITGLASYEKIQYSSSWSSKFHSSNGPQLSVSNEDQWVAYSKEAIRSVWECLVARKMLQNDVIHFIVLITTDQVPDGCFERGCMDVDGHADRWNPGETALTISSLLTMYPNNIFRRLFGRENCPLKDLPTTQYQRRLFGYGRSWPFILQDAKHRAPGPEAYIRATLVLWITRNSSYTYVPLSFKPSASEQLPLPESIRETVSGCTTTRFHGFQKAAKSAAGLLCSAINTRGGARANFRVLTTEHSLIRTIPHSARLSRQQDWDLCASDARDATGLENQAARLLRVVQPAPAAAAAAPVARPVLPILTAAAAAPVARPMLPIPTAAAAAPVARVVPPAPAAAPAAPVARPVLPIPTRAQLLETGRQGKAEADREATTAREAATKAFATATTTAQDEVTGHMGGPVAVSQEKAANAVIEAAKKAAQAVKAELQVVTWQARIQALLAASPAVEE